MALLLLGRSHLHVESTVIGLVPPDSPTVMRQTILVYDATSASSILVVAVEAWKQPRQTQLRYSEMVASLRVHGSSSNDSQGAEAVAHERCDEVRASCAISERVEERGSFIERWW